MMNARKNEGNVATTKSFGKELSRLFECNENQSQNVVGLDDMTGRVDNIEASMGTVAYLRNAGIHTDTAEHLNAYNTMRGGTKGYSGFVFEEMHAADAAVNGENITVLNNNGSADFLVRDVNGRETLVQAKAGYKPGQVDWTKYKGQTIVVDKGNTALANEARTAGLKVQESAVYKSQADMVAKAQQFESKITGKVNAPITGTVASAHGAGLASAKLAGKVGVSMKAGENLYDVVAGDKSVEEAAADVIVDGAVMVGTAYAGTAVLTGASVVASSAVTALGGTAAGAAVAGAASTAVAAIGSTAVGGAVVAGVGTVATAAVTTLGTIAAAPVLPVVAVSAAIGFAGKAISSWLR